MKLIVPEDGIKEDDYVFVELQDIDDEGALSMLNSLKNFFNTQDVLCTNFIKEIQFHHKKLY